MSYKKREPIFQHSVVLNQEQEAKLLAIRGKRKTAQLFRELVDDEYARQYPALETFGAITYSVGASPTAGAARDER